MSSDTKELLSLNPTELFDNEAEYNHLCRLFEKQYGGIVFGPSKKIVTFASRRSAKRLFNLNPLRKTGHTEVYQNKNGIKITLDVDQFRADEVNVKSVDRCVVIEGKHKERKDYHGSIARSFTRKYYLPKHVDPNTLTAKLSSDGLLIVTAFSNKLPPPKVRVIDICRVKKWVLYPTVPPTTASKTTPPTTVSKTTPPTTVTKTTPPTTVSKTTRPVKTSRTTRQRNARR